MLTSWKSAHTSIEWSPPSAVGDSAKKKRKEKKSGRKSLATTTDGDASNAPGDGVVVGAQFVRLAAQGGTDPLGRKRRKKSDRDGAPGGASSGGDAGMVLCLTSPHRVVFMDSINSRKSFADRADGSNLKESESRSYVARPGTATRFVPSGQQRATASGGAFAGMVPPGVQYCPPSNLVYAARDGGREIAIWTAAPGTELAGPDDNVGGGGQETKGRKRKSYPPQWGVDNSTKGPEMVSRRLRLPEGRTAATLTPFVLAAPPSHGMGGLAAVGAAGCCDDGSVWVAFRFQYDESWDEFQVLIVDASSMAEEDTNDGVSAPVGGTKANSKRRNSLAKAKAKASRKIASCVLLDSSASTTGGLIVDGGAKQSSFLLSIQSVMLSGETDSARVVSLRNHQVRITRGSEGGKARASAAVVERFTKLDVLQLGPSEGDVAVKLGANAESLSIIHCQNLGKAGGVWSLTSADISRSGGSSIHSLRSFPLPLDDAGNGGEGASVFSFGMLGRNVVAVLMKSLSSTLSESTSVLTLRIIDFRRRAELSSLRWIEGSDNTDAKNEELVEATTSEDSLSLRKMLYGKKCHAMITNELDGSIALFVTPGEHEKGQSTLEIVSSKLGTHSEPIAQSDADLTIAPGSSASLASALRSAATPAASFPMATRGNQPKKGTRSKALDLVDVISKEAGCSILQSGVDTAVDEACALLATSSKELIELALSTDAAENGSIAKGKSRNGISKASKKNASLISWKDAYQEGCSLILKAREAKRIGPNEGMVNGARHNAMAILASESGRGVEMPKRFIEAAFREAVTVLLSLDRLAKSSLKVRNEFQKTVQEVTSSLVEILRTNLISARADYGFCSLHHGNLFLTILQAIPSPHLTDKGNEVIIGKLQFINAVLGHVGDIPEGVLVSLLRFILRNVRAEDVVAYYSNSVAPVSTPQQTMRLSNQYKDLLVAGQAEEAGQKQHLIGTRLLSEAVLNFTSMIVRYSNCNHSFLTMSMRESIGNSDEVETLLLTLARLLKSGGARSLSCEDGSSHSAQVSLTTGTIHWITALTDAHAGTISKITNDGGLVIDRMQRALRSAMAQAELAKDVREISDLLMSSGDSSTAEVSAKPSVAHSSPKVAEIVTYSMERLAF